MTSLVEFPPLKKILNQEDDPFCGWAFAASKSLLANEPDLTLGIVSIAPSINQVERYATDDYIFYRIPSVGLEIVRSSEIRFAEWIIHDFMPDIIHLNGTEYSLGLEMIRANKDQVPVLGCLQGLASVCSKYNHGYLSIWTFLRYYSIRDFLKQDGQMHRNKVMQKRGEIEIELLHQLKYVVGRTQWDRVHTEVINPRLQYYNCNETLRPTFRFAKGWTYQDCIPHTLFCSNGSMPLKGLHFLVEALSFVKRSYPQVLLRVAGPNVLAKGWKQRLKLTAYQRYLSALIIRKGLEDNVVFCGFLDEYSIIQEYQRCNVFVLPSCIENSSNSLCEAQLLGVPCVSSVCGGASEFIDEGKDGFLYRCEEVEMLADIICRLFAAKESVSQYGQKAREKAMIRHDAGMNARQLLHIYRTIINNNCP